MKIDFIELHSNLSEIKVKEKMLNCRVAILPTSTMCLEALSLGVNVVTGYYVENQLYAYRYLMDNNYILGLNDLNILNKKKTIEAINKSFEKKIESKKLSLRMKKSKKNHLRNFNDLML